MKAAVYHGKQNMTVEEVKKPEIGPGEVMIQVKYCGICGTDIHIFNGDGGSTDVTPPLIPGHEFSGIVAAIGEHITSVQVGDRVCGDPNDMCGECYFCKNGQQHFCLNNTAVGVTADGGFAEYVVMREKQVYKIADSLSMLKAAMVEPISCCIHGIDLCQIKTGDTVLVIGGGPIGIIMLQMARNAGAAKVILSEPVKEKRELALELGADLAVDPLNENIDEVLKGCCANIDKVIECVGSTRTQADAVRLAGKGALIMFFGLTAPDDILPLKPDDIFKKELTITSSYINPYTFERAIQVLESGRVDVERIITNIVPLTDITDAFTKPEFRTTGKVMVQIS